MTEQIPLLDAVMAYLADTGMPHTQFGKLAVNEKHFVKGLKAGRRCWPDTEAKVRHFMATGESAHVPGAPRYRRTPPDVMQEAS